ncbi:aminopeptidase [Patulibacter sp.]|uniref:aminopeptidase n=1 Tax=Patulibacter sp. TaxID=1912859 RepID=UPI00271C5C5E|nr:aminopeptidase [Patulibacter sp.]MDO9409598.1 aminopeptidase [Patulibacter sp.]
MSTATDPHAPDPLQPDAGLLERLAALAVRVGANVQPGQVVAVGGQVGGHEPLVRAIAAEAYRAGASYVDVAWFDPLIKRARLEHAAEDTLDVVPPWLGARMTALGEARAANISLVGQVRPGVFAGIDPARVGKDQLPSLRETAGVINRRELNWTVVPAPNAGWAGLVFPDLPRHEALRRLEQDIATVLRLEDDPVAAWQARAAELRAHAAKLNERSFDAIRLIGPGTYLTVGLLPSSRFIAAGMDTVGGISHQANVPTEEVFTTPDPTRVDGVVRATKPLTLGGTTVDGIEVEFSGGEVVRADATTGVEVLRGWIGRDEGARRLGELALVDGDGRVGQTGTVFHETLLDENAASHLALGSAYTMCLADEADHARANRSAIHVDFMVGSHDVRAIGLDAAGTEVEVLVEGGWRL